MAKKQSNVNRHGFPILRDKPKPRENPTPRSTIWMTDKMEIYKKTNFHCWYCGCKLHEKNRTIDHLIPWSKGGTDEETNLIGACKECNECKGQFTVEQFRKYLEAKFETNNFKFWGEMQIFVQKD